MKNELTSKMMEQLERAAQECGMNAPSLMWLCYRQIAKECFFEDIAQRYADDDGNEFSDEEVEQIYAIYDDDNDSDLSYWDNVDNAVHEYKRRKNYKEEVSNDKEFKDYEDCMAELENQALKLEKEDN